MESGNIDSCEAINKPHLTKQQKKNRKKREALKRRKQNMCCMNCVICELPPEIWERIFHHVNDVKDVKTISYVSHMFYNTIKDKLWNAPKLRYGMSPDDFLKLKHLPVKDLDTNHFGILNFRRRKYVTSRWVQVISQFTQLTSLKLGWNINVSYSDICKLTALTNLKSLIFEKLYVGLSKAILQLLSLPLESFSIQDVIYDYDIELISKYVSQMSTIKKLEIQTNDKGCVYLSNLSQLEELIINNSNLITIAGVNELCKLKSLKKAKFYKCWFSNDIVGRNVTLLKSAIPNLQIEVDNINTLDYDYAYGDDDYDYDSDYDECIYYDDYITD